MHGNPEYRFVLPRAQDIFKPATCLFVTLMIIGYVLTLWLPNIVVPWLALSVHGMANARIWQLITYPFVGSCTLVKVFDILFVLLLGSAVEREWRTRSYLILWLVVSVATGLLWLLASLLFMRGAVGTQAVACVMGIVAAFGLLFRKRTYFFWFAVLEAQTIAWILIGVEILLCLPVPINLVWVLGALIAYLYIRFLWQREQNNRYHHPAQGIISSGFVDID